MTEKDLASQYLFELDNYSDHVSKLAQCAQTSLKSDDFAEALDCLKRAEKSASLIGMYLRDSTRQMEKLTTPK